MGSCVSVQGSEKAKDSKSRGKRPSQRKTSKATQVEANKTPNIQEAIERTENIKENLEGEIEKLEEQIEGTEDDRQKQSLQRRLRSNRRSLSQITATLNRLDKAYEDETGIQLQTAKKCSRQCSKMSKKAGKQVDAFSKRVSQTAL